MATSGLGERQAEEATLLSMEFGIVRRRRNKVMLGRGRIMFNYVWCLLLERKQTRLCSERRSAGRPDDMSRDIGRRKHLSTSYCMSAGWAILCTKCSTRVIMHSVRLRSRDPTGWKLRSGSDRRIGLSDI